MPRQATVYTIVIASPGDTEDERQSLPEVVHAWNAAHSLATGVVLQPVTWETHAAQTIINRQVVRDADILVGVFWTRLGTPTGETESGTIEAIEELRRAGKRVLLYFSDAPVIPSKVNGAQYERLESYRERCRQEGLADKYESLGELREKFDAHLTRLVRGLREQPGQTLPAPPTKTQAPARAGSVEPPRQVAPHPAPAAPSVPDRSPKPEARSRARRQILAAPPVDDATAELRAAGWRGVQVGDHFYAWDGPLHDLPDREPVEMPNELDPGLKKALEEAGAVPSWQTKSNTLTWRDEQRLFLTDRRTYRRPVVCGNTNVLVVRSTR
jgi:hypothetical protein